jgi:hypothetical protein
VRRLARLITWNGGNDSGIGLHRKPAGEALEELAIEASPLLNRRISRCTEPDLGGVALGQCSKDGITEIIQWSAVRRSRSCQCRTNRRRDDLDHPTRGVGERKAQVHSVAMERRLAGAIDRGKGLRNVGAPRSASHRTSRWISAGMAGRFPVMLEPPYP